MVGASTIFQPHIFVCFFFVLVSNTIISHMRVKRETCVCACVRAAVRLAYECSRSDHTNVLSLCLYDEKSLPEFSILFDISM